MQNSTDLRPGTKVSRKREPHRGVGRVIGPDPDGFEGFYEIEWPGEMLGEELWSSIVSADDLRVAG